MNSWLLHSQRTHTRTRIRIHCKLCSSVHSLIHLFIRVYAFIRLLSFDVHTHTRTHTETHTSIAHEQRDGGKLKMQTKCTIYIHTCTIHAIFSYYVYIIFYYKRCQILRIHINGDSPLSLSLVSPFFLYEMCADKI